jgi:hypothetical protein
MFEDGFNAFVAAASQHQGALAGGFQSCLALALSQPENAQAGPVVLAEPTVLIPLWIPVPVLLPEQEQRA